MAVETINNNPPPAPTKKEPAATDEGLPTANMGAFAAALSMAIGQMTNMLGVVGQNSADITRVGAAMQQGWMAVDTQQYADAENNLAKQEKQAKHRKIFGHVLHAVIKAPLYMAFPPAILLSHPATRLMDKVLPEGMANVMTAPGDKFQAGMNKAEAFEQKYIMHPIMSHTLKPIEEHVLKPITKALAFVYYHELKLGLKAFDFGINKFGDLTGTSSFTDKIDNKVDHTLNDKVLHAVSKAAAEIAVMVALMVIVTVATDGAGDAMLAEADAAIIADGVAELLAEGSSELLAEGAVEGLAEGALTDGAELISRDLVEIEMQDLGAEVAESTEELVGEVTDDLSVMQEIEEESVAGGNPAVEEEAVAEAPADAAASTMSPAEQQSFRQIMTDMLKSQQFWDTARWVETISNIVKGVEELGNSYFTARQSVLTEKFGQTQAGLQNSQFALQQISQINKMNADGLKQTIEEVFSDIKGLLTSEADALGAMAQGMYGR